MSLPWMPLYIEKYRADTMHLCAAEHGAYLLLIMHYWQKGALPNDDRQLARIACMTAAEWKRSRATIFNFFDEGWKHGRIDKEIAVADEKYQRRASAGKRGGEASAKSKQSSSNAGAMLEQCLPDAASKTEAIANHLHLHSPTGSHDDGDARASGRSMFTPEAKQLCDNLMRIQRLETDDPRCIAALYTVQAWLTKGWSADAIREAVDVVMSKRSEAPNALRYFEKAIATAHAERARPLPTAVIQESERHVVSQPARTTGVLEIVRRHRRLLENSDDQPPDRGAVVGLPSR